MRRGAATRSTASWRCLVAKHNQTQSPSDNWGHLARLKDSAIAVDRLASLHVLLCDEQRLIGGAWTDEVSGGKFPQHECRKPSDEDELVMVGPGEVIVQCGESYFSDDEMERRGHRFETVYISLALM